MISLGKNLPNQKPDCQSHCELTVKLYLVSEGWFSENTSEGIRSWTLGTSWGVRSYTLGSFFFEKQSSDSLSELLK